MNMRVKKNQSGVAMVSIMIIITLMAIMSATVLQLSYLSYTRKVIERRSNETYYTAESCIDTIKSAVQNKVATQLGQVEKGTDVFLSSAAGVLSATSLGMPLEEYLYRQVVFKNGIPVYLADGVTLDPTCLKTDADYYNGYVNGDSTTIYDGLGGASRSGFSVGSIVTDTDKLTITNVKIIFTNKQGYTAEITTDIVVNAPMYVKVSDAPVASYSMFAGAGAYFRGSAEYGIRDGGTTFKMDNLMYVHQEGNVYFGKGNFTRQKEDGSTGSKKIIGEKFNNNINVEGSLYLDPNGTGGIIFSVGGTNCVFNGDVFVGNGSVLSFTGGDGTKDAKVRVNGCIYLNNGASLLMSENVRLECQGIYVCNSADPYPKLADYVEYTGAGDPEAKLSPYYPVNKEYIPLTNSMYTDYLTKGTKTVLYDVIRQVGGRIKNPSGVDNSKKLYDARFLNVAKETQHACGVYILATKHSAAGWEHSDLDQYYLVKKENGAYKTPDKATAYKGNLYCDPADLEYVTKDRVWYGTEVQVDYEFANIMNIPVLSLWRFDTQKKLGQNHNSNYGYVANFSNTGSDTDTFTMIKYKDLKDYLKTQGVAADVVDSIEWDDIKEGLSNISNTQVIDMKDRGLRVPKTAPQWEKASWADIELSDGTTYKYDTGSFNVGVTDGTYSVVNCSSSGYYISVSESLIELHVKEGDTYVGLFLSGETLWEGGNVGLTKGVSMLEAANRTKDSATRGITNVSNPVRQMLTKLSKCPVFNIANLEIKSVGTNAGNQTGSIPYTSLTLFDNVLANGAKSFWTMGDSNGGGGNGADNSNTNLVEVDNYQKN